jgi:Fic family protein
MSGISRLLRIVSALRDWSNSFGFFMNVLYRSTGKGQQTRSTLLQHIHPGEELTRDDLIRRSGLTYDQVRRQTRNLVTEGVIDSRISNGQRYYQLRQSFIDSSVVLA